MILDAFLEPLKSSKMVRSGSERCYCSHALRVFEITNISRDLTWNNPLGLWKLRRIVVVYFLAYAFFLFLFSLDEIKNQGS